MKKNLTLISLMLGVMMLVTLSGVSATGGMYISDVKLDGASSVLVQSGDSVTTEVTVTAWGSGEGNDWESTAYKIQGQPSWTCVNTQDHISGGTNDESFTIIIPSLSPSSYDFSVRAYRDTDGCTGYYDDFVLDDGIIVQPQGPVCGNQIVESGEACDDGNQNNNDACSNLCQVNTCKLIIDEPVEGGYYDPITVAWHWEGYCDPDYYDLQFKAGECNSGNIWYNLDTDTNHFSSGVFAVNLTHSTYNWDNLPTSGDYCIQATMVNGYDNPDPVKDSVPVHLDLTAPEADYNIVSGPNVVCEEEDDCDYYITTATQLQITCDETSEYDWQSQEPYTLYYRWKVDEGSWTPWNIEVSNSDPGMGTQFNFPTDSRHELEYYCGDEVGKNDSIETAVFNVNSEAPVFNDKIVEVPKVSGCDAEHPSQFPCDWYVNQSTKICVSAEKGNQNHPTPGELKISCYATVWNTLQSEPSNVGIELDGEGCFTYGEDSFHELHCTATDALGNTADLYEADIVDTEAPQTESDFEGPSYSDSSVKWIDTVSNITLSATDPQPHPVEGVTTYYKYGVADDEFCYGTNTTALNEEDVDWETEGWVDYQNTPFGLPESCHVVEYYSVDKLGNTEDVQYRFVFSDHTAPKAIKEVGKPSHECTELDLFGVCEDNWDWLIPMETEITISCQDQAPHPSGEKQICYRITLDGDVVAGEYPAYYGEGQFNEEGYWCVNYDGPVTFAFEEESEHQLDFYCVDNVDKVSDVDSELFKVQGNSFKLELDEKWNLISIPFNLNVNDIDTIFGDDADKIEGVWSYENGVWKSYLPDGPKDFTEMFPGRGYWVKTTEPVDFTIDGALIKQGPYTPPSVAVTTGWNLIGHYGLQNPKPVECSLYTLSGNWESLIGFDSSTQYFIGDDEEEPTETNSGKGYWLAMGANDLYMPHGCSA